MKGMSFCIYVRSPPSPLCAGLVCIKKGGGSVFLFNLVSGTPAMLMSCSIKCCLSCCCLLCMPPMLYYNMFSVMISLLLSACCCVCGGVRICCWETRGEVKGRETGTSAVEEISIGESEKLREKLVLEENERSRTAKGAEKDGEAASSCTATGAGTGETGTEGCLEERADCSVMLYIGWQMMLCHTGGIFSCWQTLKHRML